MSCVLVVDDDDTLAAVVSDYLHRAGHRTRRASNGADALAVLADCDDVDMMVLDVMLPAVDGLEVCRRVRSTRPELPIVMLTALGEPDDRIAGLEVGADDYLGKPFSPRELVLRIDSVLRRSRRPGDGATAGVTRGPSRLAGGPIEIDLLARRASRDGEPLELTGREFDLLAHLVANPGVAFSRDHLMRQVWHWSFGDTSTVTVHVRRLREKIEQDPTSPRLIQTVWGVGYRFDPS